MSASKNTVDKLGGKSGIAGIRSGALDSCIEGMASIRCVLLRSKEDAMCDCSGN
jgi:hypothetical protein